MTSCLKSISKGNHLLPNAFLSIAESMTPTQIEERILENFPNAQVLVMDQTGGGSNFEVRIACSEINQLPRIQRHQRILQLFTPEFQTGEIHAMSIKPINLDEA